MQGSFVKFIFYKPRYFQKGELSMFQTKNEPCCHCEVKRRQLRKEERQQMMEAIQLGICVILVLSTIAVGTAALISCIR
ncbi:hypothetical protein Q31a_36170 [Aureliella helgolandensis]|uniref:Uncharacterized protein n=1 Tax=Aureliella helgolandensis TaxID=2527968 RepID=A0A518G9P6_9BACT|nr:hypothetical protein Q31a_36170 [Aureliella helgolandensis]